MTLLDNLILLSAAGLLTGLLVPFVAARMNEQRVVRQRQAEENIARDSKFIEAQTDFLDRLSTDLWRLAGKILAVSYYAGQSQQQFAEAWRLYEDSSFEELFGLRAHVSRAQHLLSAEAQQQLADLHAWLFGDVDPPFTTAARKSLRSEDERRARSSSFRARCSNRRQRLFRVRGSACGCPPGEFSMSTSPSPTSIVRSRSTRTSWDPWASRKRSATRPIEAPGRSDPPPAGAGR